MLRDTLRDLKNGDPPKTLADNVHKRGIVFVHVPKCAGSSVEKAIRPHYLVSRKIIDPETSFLAAVRDTGLTPNDETRHDILQAASEIRRQVLHYHLAQGIKCLTGHAPLGLHTVSAHPNHDFVTVLRDPMERFCSHLAFNLNGQGGHGAIDETIDAFLNRPRARTMGALYVKYFSGANMAADFTASAVIEQAKQTLQKMSTIGFTDNLEEFAADLTCLTGHGIKIGHQNRTDRASRRALSLTEEQQRKIQQLIAPDRVIYDWARESFYVNLQIVRSNQA